MNYKDLWKSIFKKKNVFAGRSRNRAEKACALPKQCDLRRKNALKFLANKKRNNNNTNTRVVN